MKNKMINTKAKIYCHSCKKEFDIYWTGLTKSNRMNFSCPHCGAVIDETMCNSIVSSMAQVHDTNHHFYKYHLERDEPMFTISVEGLCSDAAEE